jgi:regulator of sigma E protease
MQIGETEYGIGSLPLGGYVKMLGQDDDPRNMEAENERTKAIAEGTAAEGLQSGASVEKETAAGLAAHAPPPSDGLTMGVAIEKAGEALSHSHPDPVKNSDPPAKPAVAVKTADGRTVMTDPRSYTAKSVPARMAIISAGVIMNAIFAVVFATVAYYLGVPELPAEIGGVTPGDSAWQVGMEPGQKIISFNDAASYEKLRHEDLKRNVILNGTDRDLKVKVRSGSEERTYEVRPTLREGNKYPTVGLLVPTTTQLVVPTADDGSGLKTDVPLKSKDKVIAVNGQRVTTGAQLSALLVQNPHGKLQLTIEREEPRPEGADPKSEAPTSQHEVAVEELAIQDLGVAVGMGPVTAVRKGSPAETAGILPGDRIESIDGEPVGDPLSLGQRLLKFVDKTVTIKLSRPSKDNKTLSKDVTATLEAPRNLFPMSHYSMGGFAAAEPLGIAYDLLPTVTAVAPDSAAAKQLQAGDQLLSASFILPKREKPDATDKAFAQLQKTYKEFDLEKSPNQWLKLIGWLQEAKPDVKVLIKFKRGGAPHSAELAGVPSTTIVNETRGLRQMVDIRTNIAQNWSEAFWLGRRETKEQIQGVLVILHRLVTGRISITNLSGPPGILTAATQVASTGIAPMLIFLTILSANLAVINFLPIPVLDGGHMVFLAAEWVRGRPVDADLQYKLTLAGVFFLLSLMVFASAMDVGRFFNM